MEVRPSAGRRGDHCPQKSHRSSQLASDKEQLQVHRTHQVGLIHKGMTGTDMLKSWRLWGWGSTLLKELCLGKPVDGCSQQALTSSSVLSAKAMIPSKMMTFAPYSVF